MVKKKKSVKHKGVTHKVSKPKSLVRRALSKAKSTVKEALKPTTEKVEVHFVRKTLGKAPEEYHFVLHDGRRLKSLYELVDELETMSEDTFKEYATDLRNDFANWTRDIFKAPDLAEELNRVKNRFEAQKAIMKHMLRDVKELVVPQTEVHKAHEQHSHKDHKQHEHNKAGTCVIK